MVDQLDVEKLAEQQQQPEGTGSSALPGLVRELIRTPGFQQLLLMHLRDIDPDNASELVRAALWEDVAFTMSVLGASPKLVNWLAEALIELGVQLNNFTTDILHDFLVQIGRDLDVERLKEVPGAYAPLVNELLLEDRAALDGLIAGLGSITESAMRAGEETWRKIWNTADFGKIRVGITEHLEERRAELEGEVGLINPVAISNMLGVVPSLTNFILRVLTRTLEALNLPAEILANAVFQLLEDIDKAELGGLVNALAGLLNALHRGNIVLGRDEPRFKEVFGRVTRDVVDNVDGEAFKDMLVSLKEDGAVIGSVLSEYVYATPDATVQVVKWLYAAVGVSLHTAAETFRRFSELPEEAIGAIVDAYEEAVDMKELGRIINYGAVYANKMYEARPGEMTRHIGTLLASLDTEELAAAGKTALLELKDVVLADPTVSAAIEPEAVGAMINKGLAAFNDFMRENPDLIAGSVVRTVNTLNTTELHLALRLLALPIAKALIKDTDVIWNAVKPVVKVAVAAGAALGGLVGGLVVYRKLRK